MLFRCLIFFAIMAVSIHGYSSYCQLQLYSGDHFNGRVITAEDTKELHGNMRIRSIRRVGDCHWKIGT